MRSSYQRNNYAEVFRAILAAFRPARCVELGVLDGYSTLAIGLSLESNGQGHLNAYDLFDDYPYKHGDIEEVRRYMEEYGLSNIVTIEKKDAWTVHELYQPGSVDFLHVDVSNDGETVKKTMELWDPKMVQGGIICFEGGTAERDQEPWMLQYNRPPMKPEIENNEIIRDKYIFGTYLKWPGLTMLLKKR